MTSSTSSPIFRTRWVISSSKRAHWSSLSTRLTTKAIFGSKLSINSIRRHKLGSSRLVCGHRLRKWPIIRYTMPGMRSIGTVMEKPLKITRSSESSTWSCYMRASRLWVSAWLTRNLSLSPMPRSTYTIYTWKTSISSHHTADHVPAVSGSQRLWWSSFPSRSSALISVKRSYLTMFPR